MKDLQISRAFNKKMYFSFTLLLCRGSGVALLHIVFIPGYKSIKQPGSSSFCPVSLTCPPTFHWPKPIMWSLQASTEQGQEIVHRAPPRNELDNLVRTHAMCVPLDLMFPTLRLYPSEIIMMCKKFVYNEVLHHIIYNGKKLKTT